MTAISEYDGRSRTYPVELSTDPSLPIPAIIEDVELPGPDETTGDSE